MKSKAEILDILIVWRLGPDLVTIALSMQPSNDKDPVVIDRNASSAWTDAPTHLLLLAEASYSS